MKPEKKIVTFPKTKTKAAPRTGEKSTRFLIWYTLVLFSLATVLVLLSYALQAADNRDRVTALGEAAQERQVAATALERMAQLQQDNEELHQALDALGSQLAALQEENELLQSSLSSMTSRREEEAAVYETRLAELREEAARLRDQLIAASQPEATETMP